MIQLVSALYAEGPVDERFLVPIVRRTLELLLAGSGVEILDPIVIDDEIHALQSFADQVLEQLALPDRPHQVESIQQPKRFLQESLDRAIADRPRRRRTVSVPKIQALLAEEVDLHRLGGVPAYRQFQQDLGDALNRLAILHDQLAR